jgi:hemerythrin-like domain-containing protein
MNTIELLKTLRIRDKQIAQTLWVQVAQLNRRQNQLQQPSEESKTQLKNYAKGLIHHLQQLIFEEEWSIPTNIPTETTTDDSEQEPNETKPVSEDIKEEQSTNKPTTKTKKK